MKKLILIITLLIWAAVGPAWAKMIVFVSVPPQKYAAEKIGGDLIDVRIMVSPGASPATYEPRPSQMAALTKAKLYFAVGVPFEKAWLPRLVGRNQDLKVIHTETGLTVKADHDHDHSHGRGGLDPHIWLDPKLTKAAAAKMAAALIEIDPANQATYRANLAALQAEADNLDRRLTDLTAGRPRPARIMVYHPAWGYFCRAYGFTQLAVQREGKDPKPRQLAELIETARKLGVKTVFVQPQFSDRAARAIAKAVGGRVVPADPLNQDWAANLVRAAELFTKEAR